MFQCGMQELTGLSRALVLGRDVREGTCQLRLDVLGRLAIVATRAAMCEDESTGQDAACPLTHSATEIKYSPKEQSPLDSAHEAGRTRLKSAHYLKRPNSRPRTKPENTRTCKQS